MEKRKRVRLFFVLLILVIIGIIGGISASAFTSTEKEYFIPEACIYIKIIKPFMSKYGYVYLSQDSISGSLNLTDLDCIKVLKSETASIDLLINPNKKKELYLCDRFNFVTLYPNKYEIKKINFRNAAFFLEVTDEHRTVVKYPYVNIVIDRYLDSVYVIRYNERYLNSIKPIR